MAATVKLDRAGMIAVLKGRGTQRVVMGAAEKVAANAHATSHDGPVPVEVSAHEATYSAAGGVTLAHASGIGMQAKYGTLTNAATAAGLTIGKRR